MEFRPLTLDDAAAAYQATATALLLPSFTPAQLERRLEAWSNGHSWGAFDRGRLVGHARALDLETTVPGGVRLPTAGVTSVGVLPTHTRRGVLRSMLAGLLEDARRRGAVLASLRASEATIYGRFGFGVAGMCATYELAGGSRLRPGARPVTHTVRLLEPQEVRAAIPALHEEVATGHVGAVGRPAHWWDNSLGEFDDPGRSLTRWVAVSVDEHGRTDGYVDVALDDHRPSPGVARVRRLVIGDLFAGSDGAYRALWRHVLEVDLVASVIAPRRPVDERLRWLLEDPRAMRTVQVIDEQWLRLLDVDAALAARRYAAVGASVVVEVRDEQLPANAGCFRIGPDHAARSTDPVDVRLDVTELGALYLGGVRAADLAATGRLEERRAGAAAALDALLAVGAAPWCGSFF
ncbi:MAG: GNAT family N-acetyltransferase [Acidimicrobiales bacterium]|nr:GNAT family N-acetyltransferase [Acidimicrobiales bacterium]